MKPMKNPEINQLLQEILTYLKKIEIRNQTKEMTSESDSLIKKTETRADNALHRIGLSFDRIHDKLFMFNDVMIVAFLGFSKFPSDKPIFALWSAVIPLLNLIFLIILEKKQMEIYRHESLQMEWHDRDRERYGRMIRNQNLRSLLGIITTGIILIYLFVSVIQY